MTVKSMRLRKLPLHGSNVDSPDPESEALAPATGNNSHIVVVKAQRNAFVTTKSHTVSHTRSVVVSPVPPDNRGGL
jgi:hypothetical protein